MKSCNCAICTLSPRRREILFLIAHGYGSKQIADQLGLLPETIRDYRGKIYAMIGAVNAPDAVRRIMEHRWELSSRTPHGSLLFNEETTNA